MKCSCGSTEIYSEEGYDSIYRCKGCNKVGSKQEFEG